MHNCKFDAILFDKDGTIFDSEQVSCDAWVTTSKAFGVEFTVEMFKEFIGIPTLECYQIAHSRFGKDFPMDDFIQQTRHYINQQKAQGLPVKKGFDRFFQHIGKLNIPLGVVTSAEYHSTMSSFQGTNYLDTFDVLVTIDDVKNPKPAPDCYLLACHKLQVDPKRTLVFEDSNTGIKAALNAGCHTVAIPDLLDIDDTLASSCYQILDSFDSAYECI